MAPNPSSFQDADPDDLGRREFSKHRKGWDPVEVRAHLLAMAAEIKRLRTIDEERGRTLTRLEEELSQQREFDESRLTQMLGEETGRVLEAARTAAVEIRDKAEDNAARLVREAQERSDELLAEATTIRDAAQHDVDELTATARSTADELVATATAQAAELRADAEREAAELRAAAESILAERTVEAEEAAERIRTEAAELLRTSSESAAATRSQADEYAASTRHAADEYATETRATAEASATERREQLEAEAIERREAAEAAAAAIVEQATERGRAIVGEAREARERMLRDLADRRAASKRQLEALRAGRERLLETFASARESFDGITEELTLSLPAARDAAEAAARNLEGVDEDLDALAAELGLEDLSEAMEVPATAAVEPEPHAEPDTEPHTDAADDEAAVDAGPVVAVSSPPVAEVAAPSAEAAEVPAAAEAPAAAETPASHLRLVASGRPDEDEELDEGDDEVDEHGPDTDPASGAAEAIFARLRADREDDADGGDEAGGVVLSLTGEVPVTRVDDTGTEAAAEDDLTEDAEEPVAIAVDGSAALDDAAWLDARDAVLVPLERAVVRRIKRTLTDHENTVRDAVRRHRKGSVPVELVGQLDALRDAVADAVRGDICEVVTAGSTFLTDDEHGAYVDSGVTAEAVLGELTPPIVEPLRSRLVAAVEGHAGDGVDELDASLRSAFREWRNDHVPDLGGDLVTAAFNEGILRSSQPGAAHCWVVDDGGLANPDAEDNRLADGVTAGEEFPTGDLRPPAHPGCRCLLVPSPR